MSYDCYSYRGPQCPKCNFVISADEPHYYHESEYTEDTCPKCDAKFTVSIDQTVAWSTELVEDDDTDALAQGQQNEGAES